MRGHFHGQAQQQDCDDEADRDNVVLVTVYLDVETPRKPRRSAARVPLPRHAFRLTTCPISRPSLIRAVLGTCPSTR